MNRISKDDLFLIIIFLISILIVVYTIIYVEKGKTMMEESKSSLQVSVKSSNVSIEKININGEEYYGVNLQKYLYFTGDSLKCVRISVNSPKWKLIETYDIISNEVLLTEIEVTKSVILCGNLEIVPLPTNKTYMVSKRINLYLLYDNGSIINSSKSVSLKVDFMSSYYHTITTRVVNLTITP